MLGITLAAVIGCGGSHTSQARRAVFVASEAVVAVDAEIAREYTKASDEAVQIADTVPEYRRLMAPWNETETTLRCSARPCSRPRSRWTDTTALASASGCSTA